jgi:four helix bundle protein
MRLQKTNREFNLSNQLIRSATSINANLHEARSSESLKDYTHKVFIAFKESRETHSWLTLLKETEYISEEEYCELYKEINGISSALYAITTAMRKKLEAQKKSK